MATKLSLMDFILGCMPWWIFFSIVLLFGIIVGYLDQQYLKNRLQETETEITQFCDNLPVKITNTYVVESTGKGCKSTIFAVVQYENETKVAIVDPTQGVNIGDFWYLQAIRKDNGDEAAIGLKERVK